MLLSEAWTQREPNDQPYRWVSTRPGEFIDTGDARRLLDELPAGSFVRRESGEGSDKSYRNYSRELVNGSRDAVPDLPPLWQELIGELLDDGYRKRVAALLDQPVAAALEIRLVRHAPGDWLGPHTDRPDKVFSHVLYLNPRWRAEWGGCLQILGSANPADVTATVVPELGASALLARADNSWHQVSRVAPDVDRPRTSLLVHGLGRP